MPNALHVLDYLITTTTHRLYNEETYSEKLHNLSLVIQWTVEQETPIALEPGKTDKQNFKKKVMPTVDSLL